MVLRSLFAQLLSGLIIVGLLVGWWMSAGRDLSVMAGQAYSLAMWVGSLFEPVIGSLFDGTGKAAANLDTAPATGW